MARASASASRRHALLVALGLSVLCLGVYYASLGSSVGGGDSGELITAAWDFGVAHPPGYPLWILLAKLFIEVIPAASVAVRVNLLSAVCDAAAAGVICYVVSRQGRSLAAGVAAGGLWAFGSLIWRYAIVAEVFALNNLFVALLVAVAFAYWRRPRYRLAWCGACLFGLGLTNHQTLLFVGLPLVLMLLRRGLRLRPRDPDKPPPRRLRRCHLFTWKRMGGLVGAGLLGLLPYLQMPLASSMQPRYTWGDQSTYEGFKKQLLREEYGTFRLTTNDDDADMSRALGQYFHQYTDDLLWVGLLLAGLGLASGRRRGSPLPWLLGIWIAYLIIFQKLANIGLKPDTLPYGVFIRFWQLPHVLGMIAFGLLFARAVRRHLGGWAWLLVLVALGARIGVNFGAESQRGDMRVHDYGVAVLENLPQNAILLSSGDLKVGAVRYAQGPLGVRSEVPHLAVPLLAAPWFVEQTRHHFAIDIPGPRLFGEEGFTIAELIAANPGRPFCTVMDLASYDRSFEATHRQMPFGLVNLLVPRGAVLPVATLRTITAHLLASDSLGAAPEPEGSRWERTVWLAYYRALWRTGDELLKQGIERDERALIELATDCYEKMDRNVEDTLPVSHYKNAAIAYFTLQRSEQDRVHMRYNLRMFQHLAPADHPFRPKARTMLERVE